MQAAAHHDIWLKNQRMGVDINSGEDHRPAVNCPSQPQTLGPAQCSQRSRAAGPHAWTMKTQDWTGRWHTVCSGRGISKTTGYQQTVGPYHHCQGSVNYTNIYKHLLFEADGFQAAQPAPYRVGGLQPILLPP